MAVDPVAQAAPARAREIFVHRQRIDVAGSAAIEIAGRRMVNGMGAAPEVVGGQGQDAEYAASPIVGEAWLEESAVPAIVLDHEKPYQESGGRHGKQEAEPVMAEMHRTPHQEP